MRLLRPGAISSNGGGRLAVFVAAIIGLTLVIPLIGQAPEAEQKPIDIYQGIPLDAKLLALDKAALDRAYEEQLVRLFETWLKSQAGDPRFFINGLRLVRHAYNQAAQQIAHREAEFERGKHGEGEPR